jgi:hypothetical protein
MKLTRTQRFQNTVYNFIHNCILNYIHTYGNQPVTDKIFCFDNYMFTHEEFRFHRCPFHYTGTLLSMYPSMKVQ